MVKAIIFDFDGVIIESADIKTEAFKELFFSYPEQVGRIVQYHLANEGISRYVKFAYIYEQVLGRELSDSESRALGRRFSQIVLKKITAAAFVPGAKEFLEQYRNRFKFFIASGTPEQELHEIIKARGLNDYFVRIQGSPKNKAEIVKDIIRDYNFDSKEIIFVGDAKSDRQAAAASGVFFVERHKGPTKSLSKGAMRVKDLRNLNQVINEIER